MRDTHQPGAHGQERWAIGFDAHRLEDGIRLRLGGLDFPDASRGLAGHSDGDAALHALIDALLGAAHLGDIGALFPPTDDRWHGADSADLLRLTVERLDAVGCRPVSADVTVVASTPAIAPVRGLMEARIAELLGIPPGDVTVKGTTSDGLGIGADGVVAFALAAVERAAPGSS